jgi:hypothetical protein
MRSALAPLSAGVLAISLALAGCHGAVDSSAVDSGAPDKDAGGAASDDGGASTNDAQSDASIAPCGTDCSGLLCGEPCSAVFSDDSSSSCQGFTVHGFCDGLGACSAGRANPPPPACVTDACKVHACGDACALAGKNGACDDQGICRLDAFPRCAGYAPCGGKACGATCDLCPPNRTCPPHAGLCFSTGACVPGARAGCHDCASDIDCTNAPTVYCTTGGQLLGSATCTPSLTCAYTTPTPSDCGPPQCGAWDTTHTPATAGCTNDFGWQWDGAHCVHIVGCLFQGNGQTAGFPSQATCETAMAPCMQ